ncbi:Nif3-like dinuclear metal center hexameric protein [Hugenholtzia roseola]|uniref:Nif3-like dinuclear metal center hexameric protein n=1 Tax=Hugenholtzia roseola TaxID=1002 RepID=UPI00040161D1|nr:Nif3-like dinuclear metal center hexameric protein [Hugenholtzia roseola]
MIALSNLIAHLEALAPLPLQESYDNAGLLVGFPQMEISGAVVALDMTEEVVLEAHQKGCNLVVAHHPIIFGGLKKINRKNYVERAVWTAIEKKVALYAIHTNLDNVREGVNDKIADRLGLENRQILAPKKNQAGEPLLHQHKQTGAGLIGKLPKPLPTQDFFNLLKKAFHLHFFKHTALCHETIEKVALCGGAGSFLLQAAKKAGAQAFITADYKYHEFFDAENQILICDIGHYESEIFTVELLYDYLKAQFEALPIYPTQVRTNPVFYY